MTLKNPLKIYSIQDENKKLTLLSIAFPLFFQSILNQFYGTLGTMQLSNYHNADIAVSGSSIANSVFSIFTMIINMVVNGTIILSAVAIGAKQRNKTAEYAGTGSVSIVLLAASLGIFGYFFAEDLMLLMNLEGEALTFAVAYFKTRMLFFPLTALSSLFNSLIICNGKPKVTVYIGFLCSTISLVLGYIVLYTRIESMINPMYSMAWVVNFTLLVSLILTVIVYFKNKFAFSLSFIPRHSAKIFKLGIPGGMALFMYMLAQTITTSFVADMGIDVINTKIYITNIISYVPMLGNALAKATSVFMGRFRGAAEFKSIKILYRQNTLLAICVNILLSIIVLILHKPLISVFTDNPNIIAATTLIFILDIFVEIPRAVNNISENSLNPNGDVKITFITSTLSCWLGSVALSYVLCVLLDLQLVGIWIAFIADESIKAVIYLFRWKSNKWQKTKI